MKVFLDDTREAPDGWIRTYWPEEVIELLKTGNVTHLSLDHDLGDDEHGTGYDVIMWLEEEVLFGRIRPPEMKVHSANVSARLKMQMGINAINSMYRKNPF